MINTYIVTTSYLNEGRYNRTLKFVNYYLKNLDQLGATKIIILDNASDVSLIEQFNKDISNDNRVITMTFSEHFSRGGSFNYPYLWRAVYFLSELFQEADKLIYMDNDFYILSNKMKEYIKNLNSGWTTFYCNRHNFPETGCHILFKNTLNYDKFIDMSLLEFINTNNGKCMESALPVTHVEKSFVGDRYGEENLPIIPEYDYYAQMLDDTII